MEERKKSNEKITILVILIIILLLLLLFLFVKHMGVTNHKTLMPTGNVDIFDINFIKDGNSCNCACDNTDSTDNKCTNCIPVTGANNVEDKNSGQNSGLYVYDEDTVFTKDTQLNIFTQTSYDVIDDKIAPTSENSYQFVIRNNNSSNIKYSLEMSETNKYNVNMKYRLKVNGVYVAGSDEEYVSVTELNQYDKKLAKNNYNVYTLDWKWVESDNDTKVGTEIASNYTLNLKITASEA